MKKIPKHTEIIAKRERQEKRREEQERERMMNVLYDKSLKMIFHSALALEAHDALVPTVNYKHEFKRDGDRFQKHLIRVTEQNFNKVYRQDPEFTTNMFQQVEGVIEKLCLLTFNDYPLLNKVLEEFHKDKENYRDNLQLEFNRLDAQDD